MSPHLSFSNDSSKASPKPNGSPLAISATEQQQQSSTPKNCVEPVISHPSIIPEKRPSQDSPHAEIPFISKISRTDSNNNYSNLQSRAGIPEKITEEDETSAEKGTEEDDASRTTLTGNLSKLSK